MMEAKEINLCRGLRQLDDVTCSIHLKMKAVAIRFSSAQISGGSIMMWSCSLQLTAKLPWLITGWMQNGPNQLRAEDIHEHKGSFKI